MKLCGNRLHDVSAPGSTSTYVHSSGGTYERCRLCRAESVRRYRARQPKGGPRRPQRPSADTAEDFLFLYETGLAPRAIAHKLDMRYASLLVAVRRAGVQLSYSHSTREWRLL